MSNRLEHNKENAQRFYSLMFNDCRPREAIEQYVGEVYIQHNLHLAEGKKAFVAYSERMAREYPGKRAPSNRRMIVTA